MPVSNFAIRHVATGKMRGESRLFSCRVSDEGSPEGDESDEVAAAHSKLPGVMGVHDLHIRTFEPGHAVRSAHILLGDRLVSEAGAIMNEVKRVAEKEFGIVHTTIRLECVDCGQDCAD